MTEILTESIDRMLISHHRTCFRRDRILHMHNNAYEFTLFREGNVDYFVNEVTYHLEPGDLLLIRPGDIHGLFIKDEHPYDRVSVHLEEGYLAGFSSVQTDLLSCFHREDFSHRSHLKEEECDEFTRLAERVIASLKTRAYGYDVETKALIALMLLIANHSSPVLGDFSSEKNDVSPQLIQDAVSYINENLTKDLTVQTIADSLNISRSRLSHLFKEHTGTSLWNYIIVRRIQYAKQLLAQGSSITSACYECGFRDYAHFIKAFSRISHTSPGKYAKNLQNYRNEGVLGARSPSIFDLPVGPENVMNEAWPCPDE